MSQVQLCSILTSLSTPQAPFSADTVTVILNMVACSDIRSRAHSIFPIFTRAVQLWLYYFFAILYYKWYVLIINHNINILRKSNPPPKPFFNHSWAAVVFDADSADNEDHGSWSVTVCLLLKKSHSTEMLTSGMVRVLWAHLLPFQSITIKKWYLRHP